MIKFGDIVLVSIPNKQQVKGVVCGFMKWAIDDVALVAIDGTYEAIYVSYLSTCGFNKQFANQCFDEYTKENAMHDEIVKENE